MYGLDLEAIATILEQAEDGARKQHATTELATLKYLRTYLIEKRAKIQYSGETSVVPLVRIPSRLLSIEEERIEQLERQGKRSPTTTQISVKGN